MFISNIVDAHKRKSSSDVINFIVCLEDYAKLHKSPNESDFVTISDTFFSELTIFTNNKNSPFKAIASYLFYSLQFDDFISNLALDYVLNFKINHPELHPEFTIDEFKSSVKIEDKSFVITLSLMMRTRFGEHQELYECRSSEILFKKVDEIYSESPNVSDPKKYNINKKLDIALTIFKCIMHLENSPTTRQALFDSLSSDELDYINKYIDKSLREQPKLAGIKMNNDHICRAITSLCLPSAMHIIHANFQYFLLEMQKTKSLTSINPVYDYELTCNSTLTSCSLNELALLGNTLSTTNLNDLLISLSTEFNALNIKNYIDIIQGAKHVDLLDIIAASPDKLKPYFLEHLNT